MLFFVYSMVIPRELYILHRLLMISRWSTMEVSPWATCGPHCNFMWPARKIYNLYENHELRSKILFTENCKLKRCLFVDTQLNY